MSLIDDHKQKRIAVNLLCDNYEDFMDVASKNIPQFKKCYKKIYPRKLRISDVNKLPTTADMQKSFQDFA
jgi:hypothetical protein